MIKGVAASNARVLEPQKPAQLCRESVEREGTPTDQEIAPNTRLSSRSYIPSKHLKTAMASEQDRAWEEVQKKVRQGYNQEREYSA